MKQLLLAAYIVCVLVACNNATTSTSSKDSTSSDTSTMNTNVSGANVTYAYPVAYSSDWSIGDPKLAQTVLELWKDYDDNAFDRHKDIFADSVSMDLSGGTSFMNWPRDSVLNQVKKYRSSLKNAVSSVEVVTTLKPNGKDESWVCVWGKEVDTHNDGKIDSIYLQESWMFNKDGKVAYMTQFEATPSKPAKK
jgi:hypothetical protein